MSACQDSGTELTKLITPWSPLPHTLSFEKVSLKTVLGITKSITFVQSPLLNTSHYVIPFWQNGAVMLSCKRNRLPFGGFPCGSADKESPAKRETWFWSLGWEDPLEKKRLPTPVFWPGEAHGLHGVTKSRTLLSVQVIIWFLVDKTGLYTIKLSCKLNQLPFFTWKSNLIDNYGYSDCDTWLFFFLVKINERTCPFKKNRVCCNNKIRALKKSCVCISHVQLLVTPWTVAH